LVAVIIPLTITLGGTFLNRIKIRFRMLTLTPENVAVIHRLTGTKYKNKKNRITPATIKIRNGILDIII